MAESFARQLRTAFFRTSPALRPTAVPYGAIDRFAIWLSSVLFRASPSSQRRVTSQGPADPAGERSDSPSVMDRHSPQSGHGTGYAFPHDLTEDLRALLDALPERLSVPGEASAVGDILQIRLTAELESSASEVRLSLNISDAPRTSGVPRQLFRGLIGLPLLVSEPGKLTRLFRLSDQGDGTTLAALDGPHRVHLPLTRRLGSLVVAQTPWLSPAALTGIAHAGSARRYMRQEIRLDEVPLAVTIFEDESGDLHAAARSPDHAHLGKFAVVAAELAADGPALEFAIPLIGIDRVGRVNGSLMLGAARPEAVVFVSPILVTDPTSIAPHVLERSLRSAADQDTRQFLQQALDRKLS